ncbi:MAG: hypothetical protein AAF628_07720 [Planctomycetota bacterium]
MNHWLTECRFQWVILTSRRATTRRAACASSPTADLIARLGSAFAPCRGSTTSRQDDTIDQLFAELGLQDHARMSMEDLSAAI